MEKQYLSPEEVAELLGVTRRAIYAWIQKGQIPARKFGKLWRIAKDDVMPPKKDSRPAAA